MAAKYKKIVERLAAWSKKYPRDAIYSMNSKQKQDGELVAIEEAAKDAVESDLQQPPTTV